MDLDTSTPGPAARCAETQANARRWSAVLLLGALIVVADQLTKWWALERLEEPVHLFWTLRLALSFNTGMAFSLAPGMGPVVAVLAIVVVALLVRAGRSLSSWTGSVGLALVMGGALGNVGDRAFRGDEFLHGAVVDFIDLQWWPVFNVADAAIVLGAGLLAWQALRGEEVSQGALEGTAASADAPAGAGRRGGDVSPDSS